MSTQYETKDIDEGAYMGCQAGVKFIKAVTRGITVFFNFELESDPAALSDAFYSRKGSVEPKAFSQWQRDLRDMVRRSRTK